MFTTWVMPFPEHLSTFDETEYLKEITTLLDSKLKQKAERDNMRLYVLQPMPSARKPFDWWDFWKEKERKSTINHVCMPIDMTDPMPSIVDRLVAYAKERNAKTLCFECSAAVPKRVDGEVYVRIRCLAC